MALWASSICFMHSAVSPFFIAALDMSRAAVACFCISTATAGAVEKVTAGPVLVAARADQLALFAMIEAEEAARRAL